MRPLVTPIALALSFLTATAIVAQAQDDLFSSIATESVFSKSVGNESNAESPERSTRIAGASALKRLLRKVNLPAKQLTSQVVSLKISRDEWSIPVLISVSIDKSELEFALLLSKVDDESTVSAAKLLELMNVSRDQSPAFFAYSTIRKRIELRQITSNVGMTSTKIRRVLDNLARIAGETESSWTFDVETADSDDNTTSSSQLKTTPKNTDAQLRRSQESLVGVWSASRSDRDAFALQIKSGNQFALAVVSGKTSSKSSGKYTFDGTTITLKADDGTELKGSINRKSKDKFQLTINGSGDTKPLEFNRAAS